MAMKKEEYRQWYDSVDFIQENLQFYSFDDFLQNAYVLRRLFQTLEGRTKKLYQWYIFANCLNYNQKNLIWDFLNNFIDYPDLIYYNQMIGQKQLNFEKDNDSVL